MVVSDLDFTLNTKDGCKTFEAECIAYITELKNKAVSIIMAKLNESFIKQMCG